MNMVVAGNYTHVRSCKARVEERCWVLRPGIPHAAATEVMRRDSLSSYLCMRPAAACELAAPESMMAWPATHRSILHSRYLRDSSVQFEASELCFRRHSRYACAICGAVVGARWLHRLAQVGMAPPPGLVKMQPHGCILVKMQPREAGGTAEEKQATRVRIGAFARRAAAIGVARARHAAEQRRSSTPACTLQSDREGRCPFLGAWLACHGPRRTRSSRVRSDGVGIAAKTK